MTSDIGASVLARLLAFAKERGDDYNLVLNRFGLERLLYRLSLSPHADRFMLKGALLFAYWYDEPHRPTRDADLLGFGQDDTEYLIAVFRELAAMDVGDAIAFDLDSVRADEIREDNTYGGTRISLVGHINKARCSLQVDVGFGDAVTPAAEKAALPTLLKDFKAPVLNLYPIYTVIAEKYQAMVMLGLANTRMKDFYDLAVIAGRTELDGMTLAEAIAATFARRGTQLPTEPPLALTRAFSDDAGKQRQWLAFLRKNRLEAPPLEGVVELLSRLLWQPTAGPARQMAAMTWTATSGGWMFSTER